MTLKKSNSGTYWYGTMPKEVRACRSMKDDVRERMRQYYNSIVEEENGASNG